MQGQKLKQRFLLHNYLPHKNDSGTQRKCGMFYMSKIPQKRNKKIIKDWDIMLGTPSA